MLDTDTKHRFLQKEQRKKVGAASKSGGRATQAVMAENSALQASMRHMEGWATHS